MARFGAAAAPEHQQRICVPHGTHDARITWESARAFLYRRNRNLPARALSRLTTYVGARRRGQRNTRADLVDRTAQCRWIAAKAGSVIAALREPVGWRECLALPPQAHRHRIDIVFALAAAITCHFGVETDSD